MLPETAIDGEINSANILGTALIPELVLVQALGIAPRTFAGIVAKGRGPHGRVKIGRRIFYRKDAVTQWVAESEQQSDRRTRRRGAGREKARDK